MGSIIKGEIKKSLKITKAEQKKIIQKEKTKKRNSEIDAKISSRSGIDLKSFLAPKNTNRDSKKEENNVRKNKNNQKRMRKTKFSKK